MNSTRLHFRLGYRFQRALSQDVTGFVFRNTIVSFDLDHRELLALLGKHLHLVDQPNIAFGCPVFTEKPVDKLRVRVDGDFGLAGHFEQFDPVDYSLNFCDVIRGLSYRPGEFLA